MSKLIIVCGLPASGKTTFATELSRQINIVCLHKDSIKESLYINTGSTTLDDSRRVGLLSVRLLLELAEGIIANDIDVILEAPFSYAEDYHIFDKWISKYDVVVYNIICSTPTKELKDRFNSRPRHHAHHDPERVYSPQDESVYEKLPGKSIKITTNRPVKTLVREVIKDLLNTK